MPVLRRNIVRLGRKLMAQYRASEELRLNRAQFYEYRTYAGERATNVRWKDFLEAYEHTRCTGREYFLFRFYEKDRATRNTYMTNRRRNRFIHQIGDDESQNATAPGNKIIFNRLFEKYLCREWINPTACTSEEFAAFVKRHGRVMIKPACEGAGHGISIYQYAGDGGAVAFHAALRGTPMLAEEIPSQHPQMDLLNPNCLNTVRVTTYTDCDDVHILLTTLRTAVDADKFIDNFSAGGMFLAVDLESGKIISDGMDEKMRTYSVHPLTGTPLRGFQIPNWERALDVIRHASREMYALPGGRFLGWDIAFLESGETAIVECNWRQGISSQMVRDRGIYYELDALRKKL